MKKIILLLITFLLIIYIIQSSHEIYLLLKKQDVLTQAKHKLALQEEEHKRLMQQLSIAQQPDFVEEQARDKLFLTKPGEYRVSLGSENKTAVLSTIEKPIPVWQQWIARFIY